MVCNLKIGESNKLIGWVYESNREKIKQATKDLDDFYRDDALNDLQQTKDKELELLDERIEGWNKYLTALKQRYDAWQVQEDQKLLMELTNAKTEEELYQRILDDMLNYNEQAAGHYDDYIGIFEDFLDDYKTNLEKLQELKELEREYMTPDYYLGTNNGNFNNIQNLLNGNKNRTIDLTIDYSAEMEKAIAAGDLAQAKYLQTLRDEKAEILGIKLGQGNYRSNAQVISDAMEKFGMTSNGMLKNASTTKLDKSVDYTLEIYKAIARGDYDSVKAYADLRTEKAGDKLGTGPYKSNDDIIREALDYYGIRYTEDLTDGIGYLASNGDAMKLLAQTGNSQSKLGNNYASQTLTETNKSNILIQNQTGQLSNGLTSVQRAIIDQSGSTVEAIEQLANKMSVTMETIISSFEKAIEMGNKNAEWVDGSNMTNSELEDALKNGKYVSLGGGVYLDPNKKPDVYNSADEDPGNIGSQAWLNDVRKEGWSESKIASVMAEATANEIKSGVVKNIVDMKRNTDYAGKTITTGGYTVTYDNLGYAISKTPNKSSVSDDGKIVYTSRDGTQREVTKLVDTDAIKQNIETVAHAADKAGYKIDTVGGVIASQIAASSNEKITQDQANALVQQMISSGISNNTASLVNSSDEMSKLMSTMGGSVDSAIEYLKNIDASTKESLNKSYTYTGSSPSYVGGVAGGTYASGSTTNDHSGKYVDGKYYSGKSAQGGANTDYSKEDRSTSKTGTYDKYTDYSAAYKNATSDAERKAIESARKDKVKNEYGGKDPNPNWKKGYSSGLENGPVTYTGLAMLHGTPSAPEYVLNNDQAYNLLYNMSSARMAEFENTSKNDGGIQYIVQGDIILEGIDDPSKFWQEVTTAMGNRWNVTKNK